MGKGFGGFVSVQTPGALSSSQGTAALGVAAGMIGSTYLSSMVVGRYALSGGTAFGVSALTKGLIGIGGFVLAARMDKDSTGQTIAWLASAACMGSIVIDAIYTYVWQGGGTAAARLGAALRGRARVPTIPTVARVGAPLVAPIVRRAETPSGEALGGF